MAEIRINKDVPIFGENALAGEIKEFGNSTDSTDINELLSTAEAERGWFFLGVNDFPTKEQFNAYAFTMSKLMKYLYERGVAEWNTNVNYPVNGWVSGSDGNLYRAKIAQTGNDPIGDDVNWKQITFTATITGTATFTNATNNINLINIGNIGLEIGDVITVTNSVSNDQDYTVEVITDNDNIIVNEAHAGKLRTTPDFAEKALISEISTAGVTVALLAKWFNAPFDLGRGWVDVKSIRSVNTLFTNPTGRGMKVSMSGNISIVSNALRITIGGRFVYFSTAIGIAGDTAGIAEIVTKNSSYKIEASGGVVSSISAWSELR